MRTFIIFLSLSLSALASSEKNLKQSILSAACKQALVPAKGNLTFTPNDKKMLECLSIGTSLHDCGDQMGFGEIKDIKLADREIVFLPNNTQYQLVDYPNWPDGTQHIELRRIDADADLIAGFGIEFSNFNNPDCRPIILNQIVKTKKDEVTPQFQWALETCRSLPKFTTLYNREFNEARDFDISKKNIFSKKLKDDILKIHIEPGTEDGYLKTLWLSKADEIAKATIKPGTSLKDLFFLNFDDFGEVGNDTCERFGFNLALKAEKRMFRQKSLPAATK